MIAFLVDLEEDETRRHALFSGWGIFEAVRDAGLCGPTDDDGLAGVVQELVDLGLLRFKSQAAGAPPQPPGVRWNSAILQRLYDFHTTDRGRADAERYRRRELKSVEESKPASPDPEVDPLNRFLGHIQYVFGLAPGNPVAPFVDPFVGDDLAKLERYVATGNSLIDSTIFKAGEIGYRVSFGPEGAPQVDASLPSDEAVRGTAAIFRQLYADRERASFAVVSSILRRRAGEESESGATERTRQLDAWRKAERRLRANWLSNLLVERGQELGKIPPGVSGTDRDNTPEQILSAFFYGEVLHWDRKAEEIERWKADPFFDAHYQLLFIRAMAQLAALYIGFEFEVIAAMSKVSGSP